MSRRFRLTARPRFEDLEHRRVPANLSPYSPTQIETAYGLNTLTFMNGSTPVAANGAGETIAVIDAYHDNTLASDLAKFDTMYNLPLATGQLVQVNLAGGNKNSDVGTGWQGEESLDVEWAHAIAPGATIMVVEALSPTNAALLAAVDYARNYVGPQGQQVSAISMSYGSGSSSADAQDDIHYTTPSQVSNGVSEVPHIPITFFASSGDTLNAGAGSPASSPYVVSVGGTSLFVSNSTGAYLNETVWAHGASGTSGGIDPYRQEPGYQVHVQSTGHRSVPDVAFDADPNTGVNIVAGGATEQIGGTSYSSPAWAAIMAIINQGRALKGYTSLDGATQTLPDLYAAPSGSFHSNIPGPRYAPGYDTATGLGTPIAQVLVPYLINDTSTTKLTFVGSTASSTILLPYIPPYGQWWNDAVPIPVATGGSTTTTTTATTTQGASDPTPVANPLPVGFAFYAPQVNQTIKHSSTDLAIEGLFGSNN
jgi:subtilase family serine protease